jgi:hypothetical protein
MQDPSHARGSLHHTSVHRRKSCSRVLETGARRCHMCFAFQAARQSRARCKSVRQPTLSAQRATVSGGTAEGAYSWQASSILPSQKRTRATSCARFAVLMLRMQSNEMPAMRSLLQVRE